MTRVLVLVLNNFTNDSRVLRQVRTLRRRGDCVDVFALHQGDLPTEERESGYRLRRFRLTTRPWPKKKIVQIIKYLECLLRMTWAGVRFKPNVVHANDVNTLPIGYLVAKLVGANLVYDSHELWSDPSRKNYSSLLFKLAVRIERSLARRADSVITVTDSIAQHMATEMQIPVPVVVRNMPEMKEAAENGEGLLQAALGVKKDTPIILYLGCIVWNRGLEALIEAMQWVQGGAVAALMGPPFTETYVRELKAQAMRFNVADRVYFLPPVPPGKVARYAEGATIGVSPTEGSCLSYRYGLGNKMFEYLQAGLPLVVSDLPELSALVRTHDVGETFADRDAKAFAAALNRILACPTLLAHYRANARVAAQLLNWSNEEPKLLNVYNRLCQANA